MTDALWLLSNPLDYASDDPHALDAHRQVTVQPDGALLTTVLSAPAGTESAGTCPQTAGSPRRATRAWPSPPCEESAGTASGGSGGPGRVSVICEWR